MRKPLPDSFPWKDEFEARWQDLDVYRAEILHSTSPEIERHIGMMETIMAAKEMPWHYEVEPYAFLAKTFLEDELSKRAKIDAYRQGMAYRIAEMTPAQIAATKMVLENNVQILRGEDPWHDIHKAAARMDETAAGICDLALQQYGCIVSDGNSPEFPS